MQDEKHLSMEMVCEGRGKRTTSFHRAIKLSDLGLSFIRDQHSIWRKHYLQVLIYCFPYLRLSIENFSQAKKKHSKVHQKNKIQVQLLIITLVLQMYLLTKLNPKLRKI